MAKIRPLSPVLAAAAKKEINEDPARIEEDLKHLKDWLAKQPHLRARTDDQFLISFLRGAKYSLERAKEKLDAYYTLRSALPEFFSDRDPTTPLMRKIMKHGVFLPIGEDAEGRRVILLRVAEHDPNEIRTADIFKLNMMILDTLILEDDVFMVKGLVGIVDMAGLSMGHVGQLSPSLIKKAMTVFQDGYPLRPQGLHYLNMPSIFETMYNLFKSVMKEKLRKRLHVHSNMDSLLKSLPKSILPTEYGGDAGSYKDIAEQWMKKLEAWKDYFAEEAKYGADESRRPGRPRTHQDLFGLEGSFRALNVD